MTSPETTSSTRRFCCRPAAVPLDATGLSLPNPTAVIFPTCNPCLYQEVAHGIAAVLRQLQTVFVATDAVGVPLQF